MLLCTYIDIGTHCCEKTSPLVGDCRPAIELSVLG